MRLDTGGGGRWCRIHGQDHHRCGADHRGSVRRFRPGTARTVPGDGLRRRGSPDPGCHADPSGHPPEHLELARTTQLVPAPLAGLAAAPPSRTTPGTLLRGSRNRRPTPMTEKEQAMADAGFTHAAGADIPHSATSRRGMLPALAGLTVGLAYATISVYWAVGGRWLLNTVGISPSQPGQAGHLAALLAVWGAAAVKAVAAVLPLLAVGVWPRAANGGLRRLVRVLTWIEAATLTGYGLVLTASGLLVQAGVIEAAAHADRLALKWHACLWDPWFLIWGIFVFLALWRSRPASQDHLPGHAPGAAQGCYGTAPASSSSWSGEAVARMKMSSSQPADSNAAA